MPDYKGSLTLRSSLKVDQDSLPHKLLCKSQGRWTLSLAQHGSYITGNLHRFTSLDFGFLAVDIDRSEFHEPAIHFGFVDFIFSIDRNKHVHQVGAVRFTR